MRVFVLPASEHNLGDRLGDPGRQYRGGEVNVIFWNEIAMAFERAGCEIHTTDRWSSARSERDDILLVVGHPDDSLLWRAARAARDVLRGRRSFERSRRAFVRVHARMFSRAILLQLEPPTITPWPYRHFDSIERSGIYTDFFLLTRGEHDRARYFNYYQFCSKEIVSPLFTRPKRKFLTMINSNALPHTLANELYGERIRAIRYFGAVDGFDLYGYRWDRMPRHPFYFWAGRSVRRAWRGTVPDKLKTMSEYRFSLCFENCIAPGYISEKLFDCLATGSIPIYYGAPDVTDLVPAECFIDFRKFRSYRELHGYLVSLSDEAILQYREAILRFLSDRGKMRGIDDFVGQVLASPRRA